jgi:uncharacterized protein
LAREFAENKKATYFDLESIPDRTRLENPELVLENLKGLIVLDEIQELPKLFRVLRVLVDRPDRKNRFLILGSASPEIIRSASETLAGRVEFVELHGFNISETGKNASEKLWIRGGFPRSFLASTDDNSQVWREGFIRTFLERDIPQLGINIPAFTMRRFWTMLAHYHGQIWNASEIGRSMGLSDKTVRAYLDILTGTYMIRQLQPWFENTGKRQVKSPKIYLRDTGLLHSLLEITDLQNLLGNPKLGASWEGFALELTLQIIQPNTSYFWGTHSGAELDLLIPYGGKHHGFEIKFNEAPTITRSMKVALEELNLDHLWIIYPGNKEYPVSENITVLPLNNVSIEKMTS